MKHSEDQDWDRLVDRLHVEVTPEELADAERALAALPPEAVEPLPAEFVERVVRQATAAAPAAPAAPAASLAEPPAARLHLLSRWRRHVAAAAALVGLHTTGAAMTAVAVVTVSTVAVVLWVGRDSRNTLGYREAITVLLSPGQPAGHRAAAMGEVTERVRLVVSTLQRVGADPKAPSELAAAVPPALADLGQRLQGGTVPPPLVDGGGFDLDRMAAALDDVGRSAPERLLALRQAVALAGAGIAALFTVGPGDAALLADRDAYLRRLRRLLR